MKKVNKQVINTLTYYKYSILGYVERWSYQTKRYFINLGAALIGRVQGYYHSLHVEHSQDVMILSREIRELQNEISSLNNKLSKKTATVAKSPAKKKTSGK